MSENETTYASAGVDVEAGDRAVELMKSAVAKTHSSAVLGGVGGFAGLYDASALLSYKRPLLVSSTDGVGTKVAIAQAMDLHDTIGFDLVGMVVDDIVVSGAKPLFMTDYIATGKVVPERIAGIVGGIAAACEAVGAALVGGETAEHPGLLGPAEYDVAGAATGVVDAGDLLGPQRVRSDDVIIGIASSGVHSNGYSLVRRIIADAGWSLERHVPEFGRALGAELMEPTRLYTKVLLGLAAHPDVDVHALTHVTGGGLAANLARVLPEGMDAVVSRSQWLVPPVFTVLCELGAVPWSDAERTFNLGIGMVAVVSAATADRAIGYLEGNGYKSWPIGTVHAVGVGPQLPDAETTVTSGTKGVEGGQVMMSGTYRVS